MVTQLPTAATPLDIFQQFQSHVMTQISAIEEKIAAMGANTTASTPTSPPVIGQVPALNLQAVGTDIASILSTLIQILTVAAVLPIPPFNSMASAILPVAHQILTALNVIQAAVQDGPQSSPQSMQASIQGLQASVAQLWTQMSSDLIALFPIKGN